MDLIKKSKYPLAPLYEAITNALETISEKKYLKGEKSKIYIPSPASSGEIEVPYMKIKDTKAEVTCPLKFSPKSRRVCYT